MKYTKYEERPLMMELSEDVIIEILLRLPLKALGRFKSVCKSWLSLISNFEFAKLHLQCSNLTTNDPPLILTSHIHESHNIMSLFKLKSSTDITEGVELIPPDRNFIDVFHSSRYFFVGSCDGLVCLYIKRKKWGEDSLLIWNPTTNKDKQISLPGQQGFTYLHVGSCWFGFVPSLKDYMIFLVSTNFGEKPAFKQHMYIYSLRNPKWRELHVTDEDLSFALGSDSIFTNEALHSLVGRKCIHKFDLVAETFERIPFSVKPSQIPKPHQIFLDVIGEKNCLCAMFLHHSEDMEWVFQLWVLEEYIKWDSWKKLYRINLKEEISRSFNGFIGFTFNGYICIRASNGLLIIDPSCNPPSHTIVSRETGFMVTDYVESLVSPFSFD